MTDRYPISVYPSPQAKCIVLIIRSCIKVWFQKILPTPHSWGGNFEVAGSDRDGGAGGDRGSFSPPPEFPKK